MFSFLKDGEWLPFPKSTDKCKNCNHSFQFHDTLIGGEENWNCWAFDCQCQEFISEGENNG